MNLKINFKIDFWVPFSAPQFLDLLSLLPKHRLKLAKLICAN